MLRSIDGVGDFAGKRRKWKVVEVLLRFKGMVGIVIIDNNTYFCHVTLLERALSTHFPKSGRLESFGLYHLLNSLTFQIPRQSG